MISERSIFLFGEFAFDAEEKILRRDESNEMIQLPPKTCELLFFFIENAGRLISKKELLEKVWAETFVEESNLTHHIAVLRKALSQQENNAAQFIETVPRKGYRFVAPVAPKDKFEIVITERTETRIVEEEIESPENPLVGREREIAIVANLLYRQDTRILTLTGVGGAGKTSLARAVLQKISNEFSGGLAFVDLSAVRDSPLVVPTVAQHLKIKIGAEENAIEVVKNHLRGRGEFLLVLDNFEQVLEAAPEIAQIISGAVKILITSRSRLHLRVEREFQVPPLQIPTKEKLPEELIECASVELFVERARQVRANFELTDENAGAVAAICRKLEGLPLAVELAAARIRLLQPAAILERLDSQLRFLTGGAKDLPSRQQTIRAAIAWSYNLLNAEEKRVFESLSVFAGDFSIKAAEAIANEPEILDIIESLANKNLIQPIETDEETRFRLLESIREFASEKLNENGETEKIKQSHAEYFLGLAECAEAKRRNSFNQSDWLHKLKIENDNLRAALNFFLASDAEKALRLATILHIFWSVHFQLGEGRKLLEEALQKTENEISVSRGFAYKSAALLAWKQGDYDAANNFYRESLSIGERLQDEPLIAVAQNGLGVVAYLKNDIRGARKYFEDALKISRKIGDGNLTYSILAGLGEIARLEEDYAAVSRYNSEVADYARSVGDLNLVCGSLINLGAAAVLENDSKAAREFYAEAARIAEQLNLSGHLSLCFDGFGAIALENGNGKRAARFLGAADALRTAIGYELETPDRIFCERYTAKLREMFGENDFQEFLVAGRDLETSEAFALVFDS